MKTKLTIASLFFFFVLPGIANAFPGLDAYQREMIRNARPHYGSNAATGCADFSGKWKGSCSILGAKVDSAMDVAQQGCSAVQMGTSELGVGGLQSQVQT